jgi:hypothetical protein
VPGKAKTFRFSTDPKLKPRSATSSGSNLDPPKGAVVVRIDEATQILALHRTAPILLLRPGMPEKQTRDYKRNGTTALLAALEVITGLAGWLATAATSSTPTSSFWRS